MNTESDKIINIEYEPNWDEFFDSASVFGADFLNDREDTKPQER